MLDAKTYTEPDVWYALNTDFHILQSNESKSLAVHPNAQYYVRREYAYCYESPRCIFSYYKYFLYDKDFQATSMSYNGIKSTDVYDVLDRYTTTYFYIQDRYGIVEPVHFGKGAQYFKTAYEFMKELEKHNGWTNYRVKEENEMLKNSNKRLEAEVIALKEANKLLQSKLDRIYESKNDLKELSQLLYSDNLT